MARFLLLAFLLICGCSAMGISMPGQITVNKSEFDKKTQVNMEPAFFRGGSFGLGLQWFSSSPEGIIFVVSTPQQLVNIESKGGLQFNIDGKIVKLDSVDNYTKFKSNYYSGGVIDQDSRRRFSGDLALLNKIMSAKDVKVKLVTLDGYREGDLLINNPSPMSFATYVPKFIESIKAVK